VEDDSPPNNGPNLFILAPKPIQPLLVGGGLEEGVEGMSGYDFWADHQIAPVVKKRRPCLGASESCAGEVFGDVGDRRCPPCQRMLNVQEYGDTPKTDRRTNRKAKYPRPFGRDWAE
jgi:hypothetical protein